MRRYLPETLPVRNADGQNVGAVDTLVLEEQIALLRQRLQEVEDRLHHFIMTGEDNQ